MSLHVLVDCIRDVHEEDQRAERDEAAPNKNVRIVAVSPS